MPILSNFPGGSGGANVREMTYAEYQALPVKDPDTFYVITDETIFDLPIKKTSLTFSASAWTEGDEGFTQVVTVEGGTSNSLVALQPTPAQIIALQEAGVAALVVNNNNGAFIATAIGAAPTEDIAIQATITEVSA